MNLKIQDNCLNIDWHHVPKILKYVGMGHFQGKVHKKVFKYTEIIKEYTKCKK